jgi:hypothetical protein
MRNYQFLDVATIDDDNILTMTTSEAPREQPSLTWGLEGAFMTLSASFGPLEIALRLRQEDLVRRTKNLHPVPGLATTRQVTGGANSYLALGLTQDKRLVFRPTIVADASGLVIFNLVCTAEVRATFVGWLGIED